MKLRFGARLNSPTLLFAVQQGKRPGNPVGGKAQPNSKGKFTRAGSVLGRSTEDVNDHYNFHEVRPARMTECHDSRAPCGYARSGFGWRGTRAGGDDRDHRVMRPTRHRCTSGER